ncbi:efflux transporter outer membrane subunit [Sphingomonas sp. H39-1-10]|uniref:efflux transporter outer membrane subunit n=1 Tax=Sphingomonas TaxID=13687 RepID=UPI00088BBD38|nr:MULTISPECIES: efflux transporter outer membrane subunit [Sphingomonas]MDF0489983.1 efflux transporter outer membrane subunit [Sphingomonas pollutisoli]SDA36193.1 efflux transporter, outer membrane factor (OMF) lipoprotein, NodT family [Sphingomonas sp. NFR15]
MKRASAFLPALLLAACVAGPDYHVPPAAIVNRPEAAAPFLGGKEAGVSQAELPPRWWRLYGDPRLDAYVEEALAANTDLRAADANLRRASAVVREAAAARTVSTGLNGQATGGRIGGPTAGLPAPFSYALGFDVGYPLDLAGGIRRGIEAATAQAEAALAARDQVRVVVAAAVARNYARVCTGGVALSAARRVAAIQHATLTVAVRMARGGRGTRFDTDRARAAVFASEAAIPDILADRKAALLALAALMGRTPSEYPRDLETCAAIPTIARPIPVGNGAMLLRRRPDLRKAERMLAAATAGIGAAEAELYPNVSLGGSAGTAASVGRALGQRSFGFSLGPLVSWSFPNRKAVRARIEQAGADADAALAGFDGAVLVALQQTETALSAYARATDRLRDLERAANAAADASGDAERLQRFGRTPFLDVLNAQAGYADAQASLSAARASVVDRQIDLFLALGGGWD